MPTVPIKPLGKVLQQADLVSAAQIEVALQDQSFSQLPIGEILALRGWVKQETADFFAQQWSTVLKQPRKQPLGYYLQAAALLDEQQIDTILSEQKHGQTWIRFGALVVFKGWLKQTTIDFFLKHLFAKQKSESSFVSTGTDLGNARKPKSLDGLRTASSLISEVSTEEREQEDIPWVD